LEIAGNIGIDSLVTDDCDEGSNSTLEPRSVSRLRSKSVTLGLNDLGSTDTQERQVFRNSAFQGRKTVNRSIIYRTLLVPVLTVFPDLGSDDVEASTGGTEGVATRHVLGLESLKDLDDLRISSPVFFLLTPSRITVQTFETRPKLLSAKCLKLFSQGSQSPGYQFPRHVLTLHSGNGITCKNAGTTPCLSRRYTAKLDPKRSSTEAVKKPLRRSDLKNVA
jgi:hypothetical protein